MLSVKLYKTAIKPAIPLQSMTSEHSANQKPYTDRIRNNSNCNNIRQDI